MDTVSNAMSRVVVAGFITVLSVCESPHGQPFGKSQTLIGSFGRKIGACGIIAIKKCRAGAKLITLPFQVQAPRTSLYIAKLPPYYKAARAYSIARKVRKRSVRNRSAPSGGTIGKRAMDR
jgi:hypothetical protein